MNLDRLLRWIFGVKDTPVKPQESKPRPPRPMGQGEIVPIEVTRKARDDGSPEAESGCPVRTDLILRLTKEPNDGFVRNTRFVDWVSPDGGTQTVRTPQPCTCKYSLLNGFRVGAMEYRCVEQLWSKALDEDRYIYQDIHGHIVAEVSERFPCFDSYDYINEHRYYHWFYLIEGGKLWHIYYADDHDEISVTEDADEIDGYVWSSMVRLGWVKDVELQTLTSFAGALERIKGGE